MADDPLKPTPRPALLSFVDKALSALLRYDLSRTDVVKWVNFARQVLAVLLLSVVSIAGLSAALSTWQAQDLLQESLASEARAIADAVARASFVPLTLEDDGSLAALADSYRSVERLSSLRVRDASGKVRAQMISPSPATRTLDVRAPILPLRETPAPGASGRAAIGFVEVGMRTGWIDAKARTIALTNLAVCGGLTLVVWIVGVMVVGNLIERTRELVGEARLVDEVRRVNAELESFSYSVAHDLRAPLRAVDGFSQALLEGYAEKLDDQGRHFIQRLRENSRLMSQLINDLLGLSRVTRTEMRRERVDLSALARETEERLRLSQPQRDVELVLPPGLWVVADPGLMRLALDNLLGNAWKYTSRKPRARIELGVQKSRGARVFFVRDDGAGFDMAFAGKLFKPFSRLHSPGEFEGTGIGLATVQRVIERHGGRIWGEGHPGEGATFYFTLKEPS